jgi:hypothetical protein
LYLELAVKSFLPFFALLALATMTLVGCGGGSSAGSSLTASPKIQSGSVFVTGEDAPLPSVVSLNLTINSITLTGKASSPQVLSNPATVDFARLVGLRTPLAFNAVPADTYSSATFVISSPVINYVDAVNPALVDTLSGTFSSPTSTSPQTASVSVSFPTPMIVGASGLAGVHTEFDIRQSLAVDGGGQITGIITPVMYIAVVKATDPDGQITDLTGTVSSVNATANSFVFQGPYGHLYRVDVNSSTNFNSGYTVATLPTTGGFLSLQGTLQNDGSILASDVEFITSDLAFLSGRILALTPSTGPVQTVTLWVGETGGGTSTLVDSVQTVNVGAVSTYDVCFFNNSWFSTIGLFGSSSMLVGQRIFIGGNYSSSTFTPDMISLRRQGVYGLTVPASVVVSGGNAGTFQMMNSGLLGYSLGGPLTVDTGAGTLFFQGNSNTLTLTDLQTSSATTSVPIIARGLVLKDATIGEPVLWAHRVREAQ